MSRKKRVYINGRFLTQSVTGVQRYAIELTKAIDVLYGLSKVNEKLEILLISPHNLRTSLLLNNIEHKKVGITSGNLWEQLELPLFSKDGDLLLNLCNTYPLLKTHQVVSIHDTAVFSIPDNFSHVFKFWYKILAILLKYRTVRVLTNSNFSKDEIRNNYRVKSENITVTYLGADHLKNSKQDGGILKKLNVRSQKFCFVVGSMNPNKNFVNIVKAFKSIKNDDLRLIVAGSPKNSIFNNTEVIQSNKIIYAGYIDDEELVALYKHALCFIFPSYYEGFGLPPLEAMKYHCPVIASNIPSLKEILKDKVLYCEPDNPISITEKIDLLFENDQLREYLRESGSKYVKGFTWGKCAEETLTAIEEVLFNEGCNNP